MKFKATVTFPGEPGSTIDFELDHGDVGSECMALYEWLTVHKEGSGGVGSLGYTGSMKTLHLFKCPSDDIAICGNSPCWGSRALHFATAGKKYKICLKCRKKAESESTQVGGAQ
jgi:hypothetical protein